MAGKAIDLFNDWLISTNEHVLTGPQEVLDEVVNQTYLFGDLMKGKGIAKVVKGGNSITDRTQLTDTTQFAYYLPNATFDPAIEDILDKITVRWRFAHNMWAYTEHELELNEGDQYEQFKDLRMTKKQGCKVNTFNNMESALWTSPVNADMEASGGTKPYSIRAFITEDGLVPSGFTNICGIPSSKTRWRNQVSTYTAASIDTTLMPAFDDMVRKVDFQSPPTMGEYIKDTKYNKFKIVTDINGIKKYVALTRDSNDRLMFENDPGGLNRRGQGVMSAGVPIRYIKEMDAIGYSATQPRFFWINSDYLFPIFHSKRYFYEKEPMNNANQPYTWVIHEDTWLNLFCASRQRQGIIVPA